jgi:PAS domain S-box-containing protein
MGNDLQLLVESIPAHVVVTTPSGDVETVNRPALEYFGKTLEELKGCKTSDIVHPDDLQHTIAAQRKGFETGRAYNVESRHRRADGVYRWFNVLGLPLLDTDGRIIRWFHLISDIDDRKRAEEALRASENNLRRIIDSIPGLLCMLNPAGVIQAANQQLLDYFGKAFEDLNSWRFNDVVHPDDLPRVISAFTNSMTAGTHFDDELRYRRADGVYRWFQVRIVPVRDTDGGITGWYGLITDIDDRKRAEEELRRSEAVLAHASRVTSLGVLTASIAHEVLQPLTAIITDAKTCLLTLSADPPNVEGACEAARRTIRGGNRAAEVITRLRKLFSKKEATTEPVDLNEATREVIALSLSRLQRDRVILRQELADDLPAVTGDRVQLQQVILNLVLNASDAMSTVDNRPRELLIRTEREEGGVRLTVQDAGMGIQPEAVGRLFEPFYTTKTAVWESDYPSVARLSRVIMGECGQRRMTVRERHFHFLFLDPKVPRCQQFAPTERLLDGRNSRWPIQVANP